MKQFLFDAILTFIWCCLHLLFVHVGAGAQSSSMLWELILSIFVFVLYPWFWLFLYKHLPSISMLVVRVGLISLLAFILSFIYFSMLNDFQELLIGLMFSGVFFISVTLVSMLFLIASAKAAKFLSRGVQ